MDQRIKKWAELIIDWCWRLKKEEAALIFATPTSEDLVLALIEKILNRGGHPQTRIFLPGERYLLYSLANQEQLEYFPNWQMELLKSAQAYIGIQDSVNTKELVHINPEKQKIRARATTAYSRYVHNYLRWCTTLFPTRAYAQEASMSFEEFREFVFESLLLNSRNPLSEYRKILMNKKALAHIISQINKVRIVGPRTDLRFEIGGCRVCFNDDRFNLPAGEVWLAPLKETTQGIIFFGVHPNIESGREIKGTELNFENGKLVSASAQVGEDYLQSLISVDDGARYLGEFGIGFNFRMKRPIGNMLFDEKIGGTIHLALGDSFPAITGGINQSAIHEDFLFDLREEGEVLLDGRKLLVEKDNLRLE
jgi:aminopeptidase